MHYYNEWEHYPAQWLRNLIAGGLLPEGDVDERDIRDVTASDLTGYTQCHFFAGIGGWPLALQHAWPTDAPVWTGSCPCQPFSLAGRGGGTDDPRHLWPEFHRLIAECRPPVVFGEQVASLAGREWLAGVRTDLEAMGYAVGAADLCAAGLGAPNIRQRLWWVADAGHDERERWDALRGAEATTPRSAGTGAATAGGRDLDARFRQVDGITDGSASGWSDYTEIPCLDGKVRRTESGTPPLVDGFPGRVEQLRAYGNAIVPQVAEVFIRAYLDREQR
jgi:DNA (cytosine-5)-methyltransferase 1